MKVPAEVILRTSESFTGVIGSLYSIDIQSVMLKTVRVDVSIVAPCKVCAVSWAGILHN